MLGRRDFLTGLAAGSAFLLTGHRTRAAARAPILYVPGYAPESAWVEGRPVVDHPRFTRHVPKDYSGRTSLITRIDTATGVVRRALFAQLGHQIDISPDGRYGIFNSMNLDSLIGFDPASLEQTASARAHAKGYIGGGHSVFLPDGKTVLVAERLQFMDYTGTPEDHFGRIVIREAATLKALGSFSCHGIAPHEIALIEGGRQLAIVNYGRTHWPAGKTVLPFVAEPSLTVVEFPSGKLLDKIVSPDNAVEARHLAAHSRDRVFAVQGRLGTTAAVQQAMAREAAVYELDVYSTGIPGYGYMPAPMLRYDLKTGSTKTVATGDATLMRYAQSILYDPVHDQAIGTFPSRHRVIAFDGATGAVKKVINVGRMGLRQPRGIALHPDGEHYIVTGYWSDMFTFRRADHGIVRERSVYETFFGHSHATFW